MRAAPDPVQIAARVLQQPVAAVTESSRIKGGLTNESWLVKAGGQQVVVRLSNADERSLRIDRRSEQRVLEAVEQAGIGAAVLYSNPQERVLVTRYIPGRTWTREDTLLERNIRHLAVLLQRLHALPIPVGVAQTDLPGIVEGYWSTLDARGLEDPPGPLNRDEVRKLARALSDGAVRRLCHNDVHHLNLVDTGRLWLLDWEYAGIGDPCFDLASICCYHDYPEAERRLLLQHYYGRECDAAYARLELACWLFDYIRQLWIVVRAA